jgi:hypothetical protein
MHVILMEFKIHMRFYEIVPRMRKSDDDSSRFLR